MRIRFSESYYFIQILALRAELEALPNVKLGMLRGRQVVRVYSRKSNGHIVYKTLSVDSSAGKELMQTAKRRTVIKNEIKSMERVLGKQYAGILKQCRVSFKPGLLDEKLWNSCKSCENTMNCDRNYCHKGILMRSRAEVLIAEILDELGLQYKYEPAIRFGDEVYYPDFLVYLPCLKRCLIIEFFGMSDEEKYVFKLVGKLTVYANNGLIMNRDVIGLYGTRNTLISSDYIYNNIVMIVNLLVEEALQLE